MKLLFVLIVANLIHLVGFAHEKSILIENEIPDSIIEKTNNLIRSRVGERFFNEHIIFDAEKSRIVQQNSYNYKVRLSPCAEYLTTLPNYYHFVYYLQISDSEKISAVIGFETDTLGNIIPECYVDRIPECPNNDCWNYFPVIKKDDAVLIAKNDGFEEGITDWQIFYKSYVSDDFKGYIWEIKNTLSKGDKNTSFIASGKVLYISANDGTIIQRLSWFEQS